MPDVVASETPLQLLQAVKGKVTSVKVQLALNAMSQRVQSLVDSEFALLARYVRDMIRIEHINTYISLSQWLEMDISLDLIKSRLANIPSLDIELKRQLGSKDPTLEEMCDRVGQRYLTSKMHINAISIEHSPKNESGLVRAGRDIEARDYRPRRWNKKGEKGFRGKGNKQRAPPPDCDWRQCQGNPRHRIDECPIRGQHQCRREDCSYAGYHKRVDCPTKPIVLRQRDSRPGKWQGRDRQKARSPQGRNRSREREADRPQQNRSERRRETRRFSDTDEKKIESLEKEIMQLRASLQNTQTSSSSSSAHSSALARTQ